MHKCSRCLVERYCGRECQQTSWPTHRRECARRRKSAADAAARSEEEQIILRLELAVITAVDGGLTAATAGVCVTLPPRDAECWICLQRGDERALLRGCGCRGGAGWSHARCVAEFVMKGSGDWESYPTCRHGYCGPAALSLAHERLQVTHGITEHPSRQHIRALGYFAALLLEHEQKAHATPVLRYILRVSRGELTRDILVWTLNLSQTLMSEVIDRLDIARARDSGELAEAAGIVRSGSGTARRVFPPDDEQTLDFADA